MTPLTDIIRYLRTDGDTSFLGLTRASYSDFSRISFAVDAERDVGMTSQEQANAELAFTMWAELVAKPTLILGSPGGENIVYSFSDDGFGPESAGRVRDPINLAFPREVIINRNLNPEESTAGYHSNAVFYYTLHEIGHALGLTHPGPYNGEGAVYGEDNVYPEDNRQFTVMSYFTAAEVQDVTGERLFSDTLLTTTPLLHDIAAIQSIYGAATSVRSGNTVYGYNSNVSYTIQGINFQPFNFTQERISQFSIFDTGGIDTIDASGVPLGEIPFDDISGARFPDQVISLEQGTFSSIGAVLDAQGTLFTIGLNNVSIAYGSVIENAIGGAGNDTITGNSAGNKLEGLNGNDILNGADGNDTLFGGDGDDRLDGGNGDDLLNGGGNTRNGHNVLEGRSGNDIFVSGGGIDHFYGGPGFDTVSYGLSDFRVIYTASSKIGDIAFDLFDSIEGFELTALDDIFHGSVIAETINGLNGNDDIRGGAGDDTLLGASGNDTLNGEDGNDNLQGGADSDSLLGGNGNDTLNGGAGADSMNGGDGNDTYFVDSTLDVVFESRTDYGGLGGIDLVVSDVSHVLSAGVEDLTLSPAATALNATGNNLGNQLRGNSLNNVLNGGLGADLMVGGGGNDTYIVDNAGDIADESTGSGIDIVQSSVSFSLANGNVARGAIENLTLTGSAAVNATGSRFDNVLLGNSAVNVLDGLEGNDRLLGQGGNDLIFAGSGDDYMSGGVGNDYLEGSIGNDTYDFTRGFSAFLNLGSDTIADTGGSDRILIDSMSQLRSVVRSGNDAILTFDQGTIRVVGHFQFQTVESVEVASSKVVLATGLVGGNLSGIITGTDQSELLDGKGGDDFLFGNQGNDTLLGDEGDDRLEGGTGRDRLDGGVGDDLLVGGSGQDTFVFAKGYGHDTISDFSILVDRLDLSGFDERPDVIVTAYGLDLDFGGGDILSVNSPLAQWHGLPGWLV